MSFPASVILASRRLFAMRSDQRFRYIRSYSDSFPIGVKWLLISNIAVFFGMLLAEQLGFEKRLWIFELVPETVVHSFTIWQLVTYMFMHAGLWHIVFNMLTLYWFGPDLERTWGLQRFLKYYFVCGIGAGICVVLAERISLFYHWTDSGTRTLGASGAIYGVLLAYGLLFPDRTILLIFIPIKARHFLWFMGLLAFYSSISGGNSGVSNVAHLGGLLVGYLYIRMKISRFDGGSWVRRYQQWKLQRAKKKFQVYMRKHGGPGGTMLQ
jgi:membrane associated rhomboid family serine protease